MTARRGERVCPGQDQGSWQRPEQGRPAGPVALAVPDTEHSTRPQAGRSVGAVPKYRGRASKYRNTGFLFWDVHWEVQNEKTGFRSFLALFVLLCFCVPRRAKICRWRLSLVVFQYNPGSGGVHPPPGRPAGRVGRSGLVSATASAAGPCDNSSQCFRMLP